MLGRLYLLDQPFPKYRIAEEGKRPDNRPLRVDMLWILKNFA